MVHPHQFAERVPDTHYRKCAVCGSLESLIDYPRENYLHNYWGIGIHSSLDDQRYNLTEFKNEYGESKVDAALKHCSGNTLLEIACAPGSFLKAAKEKGMHCEGVEPSGEYVDEIRNYAKCHVHLGFFEDLDFPSRYDSIVALDLLEHLRDTEAFVRRCGALLNANGGLVIMSPIFMADGFYDDKHYQPEHVFLPTQTYLQELFSEYFRDVSFDRHVVGHELVIGKFPK